MNDAVELYGPGRGPLIITCEHASARVPPPLELAAADRPWLATHWGVDLGADALVRELARRLDAAALLARFSRLVCDANRPEQSPTLILERVEGYALCFNRGLDEAERARRLRTLHAPYHAAVDEALAARSGSTGPGLRLLSVHSFTPVLGDEVRPMELGVLFDEHHEPRARRLADRLRAAGFATALNLPYSGLAGMIYAARRHGQAHAVPYLELEVRQDLIDTQARARRLARRLAAVLGDAID